MRRLLGGDGVVGWRRTGSAKYGPNRIFAVVCSHRLWSSKACVWAAESGVVDNIFAARRERNIIHQRFIIIIPRHPTASLMPVNNPIIIAQAKADHTLWTELERIKISDNNWKRTTEALLPLMAQQRRFHYLAYLIVMKRCLLNFRSFQWKLVALNET